MLNEFNKYKFIKKSEDEIWFLEGYIDELKEIANGKSKKKRKC